MNYYMKILASCFIFFILGFFLIITIMGNFVPLFCFFISIMLNPPTAIPSKKRHCSCGLNLHLFIISEIFFVALFPSMFIFVARIPSKNDPPR